MENIKLSEGSGGKEMDALIKRLTANLPKDNRWSHSDNDAAVWRSKTGSLLFTTDSFVIDPVFIPGGNIGKIAMCGTINDLAVMGAEPSGISLGLVIEEGFSKTDLDKIMQSIAEVSGQTGIPVVTGDTKVLQKSKVDGIIINTAGIGIATQVLDQPTRPGDKVIISGNIGDHAIAVLSRRFDFQTDIITDSKPITDEIKAVKHLIRQAKDPTRGGIAAALNEICRKDNTGMLISEKDIPMGKETKSVTELLGLDPYSLACEGRCVCIAEPGSAAEVVSILKRFNQDASIIGEVTEGKEVILDTGYGKRILPSPSGNIVPRIC